VLSMNSELTYSSNLNSSIYNNNINSNNNNDVLKNSGSNFNDSLRVSRTNYTSSNYSPYNSVSRKTYLSPVKERSYLQATSPFKTSLNRSIDLGKTSFNSSMVQRDYESGLLEENLFIDYLKEILTCEREIERIKCELAVKSDFNLTDLFRMFEYGKQGFLNESDIKFGINLFGVYPTNDEINLLIKRYDGGSSMRLSTFSEMYLPVERDYNRLLSNRTCLDYHVNIGPEIFSYETKYLLSSLFNALIKTEKTTEYWRQKFYSIKSFNTRYVFDKLDSYSKNSLSPQDFIRNYRINSVFYNSKDIDLVFFKFDKNKDSRISYNEFCDELFPKSREFLTKY